MGAAGGKGFTDKMVAVALQAYACLVGSMVALPLPPAPVYTAPEVARPDLILNKIESDPPGKGGSKDEGGCYIAAGYRFCRSTNRCHSFNEPCPTDAGPQIAAVKTLSADSKQLSKDTAQVSKSVIQAMGDSIKKTEDSKKKIADAKAETAEELKKMTEEVVAATRKAVDATADAETKITKITSEAAAQVSSTQAEKDAANQATKAEVSATEASVKATTADSSAALAQKKTALEKKAAETEQVAAKTMVKAAADVQNTLSKGTAELEFRVAGVTSKAGEDVELAKAKATAEAATQAGKVTAQITAERQEAENDKSKSQGKLTTLRAELVEARKSVLNTISGAYDALLSNIKPPPTGQDGVVTPVVKVEIAPMPIMDGAPRILDGMKYKVEYPAERLAVPQIMDGPPPVAAQVQAAVAPADE